MAIVFLAVGQGIFGALARGHGAGVAARQAGQEVATDYAAHFNRGDQLMRQLELYAAITEFREAVRLNPDHLPSHYALALAYAGAGNYPLAWREVSRIRQANGELPEGFLNQLNAEMNEEEAVRQAKAAETGAAIAGLAVREKPKSAATHANLAAALARAGDYRGAIGEAEEALALDAHQLDAHLLLGQLYSRLPSTSQQAIPHLNAYVQKALRTPENAIPLGEAYGILGDLYRRSAREQQALAKYEEGLKLAPAEPRLWNNAAWLYATAQDTSLRNTERALAYARKAVELSAGKNASYLDTLAEAHYLNGHYDDAVELEKKAIALRPTDQFLKDQLKKLEEAQRAGAAKP